jgi:outer membrane protein TolC
MVEEELLRGLTPEFLNLKFTRQETLARARLDEVQAISDFNKSLASLYRAMGTGLTVRNITVNVE